MRRLLLLSISLLLFVPFAQAQEGDLAWLLDLLPTAADSAPIPKLLASAPTPLVASDLLLREDFSASNAWENFSGVDQRAIVDDGHYEVFTQLDSQYMWGQGFSTYSNVAVMVETEQVSSEINNGYGITCRATEDTTNADGYYFFISGDGYYTIFARVDDTQETLQEWTSSDLVHQGQGAQNRIMAVCHQDYLALYVNDVLVAEVNDDRLSEGALSLAAIVYEADSNVEIRFDNLLVYGIEASEAEPELIVTNPASEIDADALEADLQSLLTEGSRSVIIGELIQQEPFDDSSTWGEYDDGEGGSLRIENGVYNAYAQGDGGTIFWGINDTDYRNVVVQVEAQASETTEEAAFGIACRADGEASGRGYYLLVGTDGYYTLIISNGNNYVPALEDNSDLISATERNTLTAVCVNDYLALYVNNHLIFEYEDTKFPEGRIGLTIVAYGEEGEIVDVRFDNVLIWSARSFGAN